MTTYYDDNFGHWDMSGSDSFEFYNQVQAESVYKRCQGCGAIVRLRPDYGYCNGCVDILEQGGDLEYPDIPDPKVDLELQLRITEDEVEKAESMAADGCYEEFSDD